MAGFRQRKINETVTQELSDIIRNVKDYRVANEFISITAAIVTPDLKFAKVYFSLFDNDPEKIKQVKKGLYSAHGYIRGELSRRLNLRMTPELTFEFDDSATKGAKINEILKEVMAKEEAAEKTDEDEQ